MEKVKKAIAEEWGTLLIVIWGSAVYCVGVMAFTMPFRFPDTGFVGIGALLNYQFGWSMPLIQALANVVLIIWTWRELGARSIIWTVISVGIVTALLALFDGMPYPHTDQILLIAVIGGAIKGLGSGIVLRRGVTLGGIDILVLYARKRYGIEAGKLSLYINAAIIAASIYIVGTEKAMLGIAGIAATSAVLDRTIEAFDRRRQVFIVTHDPKPIVEFILTLGRSTTILDGQGGFSGTPCKALVAVMTLRQSIALRRYISSAQPEAFMIVSDAREVIGRGFIPWKQ